jgi:hypothetical protein
MRKGSKKLIVDENGDAIQDQHPDYPFLIGEIKSDPVLDILIRICDACHDIQNEQEPWASIRKDIERLK